MESGWPSSGVWDTTADPTQPRWATSCSNQPTSSPGGRCRSRCTPLPPSCGASSRVWPCHPSQATAPRRLSPGWSARIRMSNATQSRWPSVICLLILTPASRPRQFTQRPGSASAILILHTTPLDIYTSSGSRGPVTPDSGISASAAIGARCRARQQIRTTRPWSGAAATCPSVCTWSGMSITTPQSPAVSNTAPILALATMPGMPAALPNGKHVCRTGLPATSVNRISTRASPPLAQMCTLPGICTSRSTTRIDSTWHMTIATTTALPG